MYNNFEEFRSVWLIETSDIRIKKQTKNLVFIVMYPDDVEWDFGVEKTNTDNMFTHVWWSHWSRNGTQSNTMLYK